eukprot:363059-Chlamydomonas_euryale.AAC.1
MKCSSLCLVCHVSTRDTIALLQNPLGMQLGCLAAYPPPPRGDATWLPCCMTSWVQLSTVNDRLMASERLTTLHSAKARPRELCLCVCVSCACMQVTSRGRAAKASGLVPKIQPTCATLAARAPPSLGKRRLCSHAELSCKQSLPGSLWGIHLKRTPSFNKSLPQHAYCSWPYQRPVIFTSLGGLEPWSVSDGWIDSNTPAISPVAGSTLATENTAEPLSARALFWFSLSSSSASARAGRATALS